MTAVVLAPNAFKGTFGAVEVADAWAERLEDRVEARAIPLSDGGDGFLAVVRRCRPEVLEVAARVGDPAGRAVTAAWGWEPGGAAFLESAAAVGLRLVPVEARDPLRLTSAGLGELFRTAAGLSREEIVVGLGGSATVDGGLGMARALGFGFEDAAGRSLERPADLPRLARIRPPETELVRPLRIVALVDVDAPLHGPTGAARTFGPQKGARPEAVARLAEGLERMAERWVEDLGADADLAERPGAGAAGGLGGALVAFLGATIERGAEWCGRLAGLDESLTGARLLVTGEGRWDGQSGSGKATGYAVARARAAGVPAAVVCGEATGETGPGGPLVVDAGALGRPGESLGLEDLSRLLDLALDRAGFAGGNEA